MNQPEAAATGAAAEVGAPAASPLVTLDSTAPAAVTLANGPAAPADSAPAGGTGIGGIVAAEAVGTAFLVAAIIGSGIAAAAAFPDSPGLALLVNAAATGAALTALIVALGPVSAAFNPLVTLLARAEHRITTGQAAAVIGAQLTGAILGVVIANTMFALPALSLATGDRASWPTLLGETIATFGLLLIIALTVRTGDVLRIGITVGTYITAAIWFTSSTAFANPAVTLARIGTDTFTGIAPADAMAFIAAQVIALPLTYLLIRLIARRTP